MEKFLAVGILVLVYVLIVSERVHRTTAVLLGIVLVLGFGLLSTEEAVAAVHWEALGLVFGMFILVAALSASGFFRWVGLHALRAARYRPIRIFALFCVLAGLLAAFMDSITVLVFMASLAVEVCTILRLHPAPFLIGLITSANIGGSATMIGDPPNVIIGTTLGFGFLDFLANTAPIAVVAFLVNIGCFWLLYRKADVMRRDSAGERIAREHRELEPFAAVVDLRLMRIALVVFAFTVTLLVIHQLLDVVVAFVALLGATLVLVLGGRDMPELVEKIDWHTLLFLGGLFVIVGSLEKTGVLRDAAAALGGFAGGNLALLLSVLLWTATLLSAVLDNIPFTAAMVPIIREIATTQGTPIGPLAWTLALGADIGGNGTPIGASANVVGLAVAEKSGIHVSWPEYVRIAVPATLVVITVVNVFLVLRYA